MAVGEVVWVPPNHNETKLVRPVPETLLVFKSGGPELNPLADRKTRKPINSIRLQHVFTKPSDCIQQTIVRFNSSSTSKPLGNDVRVIESSKKLRLLLHKLGIPFGQPRNVNSLQHETPVHQLFTCECSLLYRCCIGVACCICVAAMLCIGAACYIRASRPGLMQIVNASARPDLQSGSSSFL